MEYIEKSFFEIKDIDRNGITFKSGEKIIPTSRPKKHPFKSANLLKENGTPATILKLLSYKKLMKTPRKVKNKSART